MLIGSEKDLHIANLGSRLNTPASLSYAHVHHDLRPSLLVELVSSMQGPRSSLEGQCECATRRVWARTQDWEAGSFVVVCHVPYGHVLGTHIL